MNNLRVTTLLTVWNTFASVIAGLVLANLLSIDQESFRLTTIKHPIAFSVAGLLALIAWVRANIAFVRGDILVSYLTLFLSISSLISLCFGLLMLMAGDPLGYVPFGIHLSLWGISGWIGHIPVSVEIPEDLQKGNILWAPDLEKGVYILITLIGVSIILGTSFSTFLNVEAWWVISWLTFFAIILELSLLYLLERFPLRKPLNTN